MLDHRSAVLNRNLDLTMLNYISNQDIYSYGTCIDNMSRTWMYITIACCKSVHQKVYEFKSLLMIINVNM